MSWPIGQKDADRPQSGSRPPGRATAYDRAQKPQVSALALPRTSGVAVLLCDPAP